jgi:uncharacterized protein YkwD
MIHLHRRKRRASCSPSRTLSIAFAISIAAAQWGCGGTSVPTAPGRAGQPTASLPGPSDPEVVSFVNQMNAHRVSLGLQPLLWHSGVAAVAQAHSQDMVDRGFFSHTNPDGELPWDRLDAAGISYTAAGENIAYGYSTGSAVLAAWLNSSGHRANIENATFTHHGVGKVGTYWTHVFIRTATSAAGGVTPR